MKFPQLLAAILVLVAVSSCKRLEERMEITATRTVSANSPKINPEPTKADRFMPILRQMGSLEEPESPRPSLADLLVWDLPQGWTNAEQPDATGMRAVDLRFGEKKEGECYITLMGGQAGGLAANINRWRSQMGQPALTEEQIAALPKKPFFNREGIFVSIDGNFKGVGAAESAKDYRLLGLIHAAPQATIFVKATGPRAVVEANAAAFDAFCASIRPNPNVSNQ